MNLAGSFAYCRRVTARSRSSFRFAFRLLPPAQRDGMHALYAFLRETDDLSDDPNPRCSLGVWRTQLTRVLDQGCCTHRCHAALQDTVRRYGIPPEHLHEVITGVEADLQPVSLRTFAELQAYCYRVAGVVGLACVHIWGLKPGVDIAEAERWAIEAGYAFQLTNILRDLSEDLRRGRVYLPAEELDRFAVDPARWREPRCREDFRNLLDFQIARARDYYRSSSALEGMLLPEGAAIFFFMRTAYAQLLERIAAAGPGVLKRRVRLSRFQKLRLAFSAWVCRWRG